MQNNFKKIILFFSFTLLFVVQSFAQATSTNSRYSNVTIQTEADRLCQKYSSFTSVYATVSAGGGGSVPVDLTQLRPVLESINNNAQLTANEIRDANLIKYCDELPNMARASNRLLADSAKQLKTLADNCYTDRTCLLNRALNSDKERELKNAQNIPGVGREVAKLILKVSDPKVDESQTYNYDLINECNTAYNEGRSPDKCLLVPRTEDVILETYSEAKERIEKRQNNLSDEFTRGNGLIASRPCTKTASGVDPSTVKFYEADCISYRTDPLVINQTSLEEITRLPFTQAYSPSSVLQNDPTIDNINTRVREGNLTDPDISTNFGTISGGGTNPITGGGTIQGGITLASVEPNFRQLLSNIGVINSLYQVGRLAYASTTSACRVLPVQTRSTTIEKLDAAIKTYDDYKKDMQAKWDAAKRTPNENHNDLALQINYDLKDKINQILINKVYDSVKALLQICVDANH